MAAVGVMGGGGGIEGRKTSIGGTSGDSKRVGDDVQSVDASKLRAAARRAISSEVESFEFEREGNVAGEALNAFDRVALSDPGDARGTDSRVRLSSD
jgi:hypothetical protein